MLHASLWLAVFVAVWTRMESTRIYQIAPERENHSSLNFSANRYSYKPVPLNYKAGATGEIRESNVHETDDEFEAVTSSYRIRHILESLIRNQKILPVKRATNSQMPISSRQISDGWTSTNQQNMNFPFQMQRNPEIIGLRFRKPAQEYLIIKSPIVHINSNNKNKKYESEIQQKEPYKPIRKERKVFNTGNRIWIHVKEAQAHPIITRNKLEHENTQEIPIPSHRRAISQRLEKQYGEEPKVDNYEGHVTIKSPPSVAFGMPFHPYSRLKFSRGSIPKFVSPQFRSIQPSEFGIRANRLLRNDENGSFSYESIITHPKQPNKLQRYSHNIEIRPNQGDVINHKPIHLVADNGFYKPEASSQMNPEQRNLAGLLAGYGFYNNQRLQQAKSPSAPCQA